MWYAVSELVLPARVSRLLAAVGWCRSCDRAPSLFGWRRSCDMHIGLAPHMHPAAEAKTVEPPVGPFYFHMRLERLKCPLPLPITSPTIDALLHGPMRT